MKNKINKNQQAGFTIVELLLYMGLFVGFLTLLGAIFVSTLEAQVDATSISHIDQDSWYLMNRLKYDLYRADSVITPASNGETSSTLVIDVSGSQITYSLVGDTLSITENLVSNQIISEEVTASNLSFKRLGNENGLTTITTELILQNPFANRVKDIDITVGLRK